MRKNKTTVENIPAYDFSIIEMIKEGFARIEGVKLIFIQAFLIYMIIAIALNILLSLVFPSPVDNPNILNQQIVGILSYPVLIPLMVGMMMLAIKYSRGETIHYRAMFEYYHMVGHLSLAGILIYILTLIGFLLLVLPGIYLSVAYVFALPLIADKGLDVWEAMELSRKAVTKNWFKVFGLMLLLVLIFGLGALALGIGLIWAIPLIFVTLYGLLYPLIFEEVETN